MDKSNLEFVNDTNQSTPRRRARRLINLSLHDAPPVLHAIGVIDPWSEPSAAMKAFYATSQGNYNNKRKDLVNAIHSGNWKGTHDWGSLFRRDMINDAYQRSNHYSRYYLEKLPRIAKAQGASYAWVEEEFEFLSELLSALEACEITPVFLRKKEASQAGEPSCATELSAYIFVEARAPHKVVEGPFDVNVSDGVDFPDATGLGESLKLVPHPERCWVDIEEEEKFLDCKSKKGEDEDLSDDLEDYDVILRAILRVVDKDVD